MNESNTFEDQAIAWEPSDEVIKRAQLTKFMKQIDASSWDELYAKSIDDVEAFTKNVLTFLDIKFDPPYEKLLDTSEGIEWAKWCVGAGLNVTEICLDRWQTDEMKDQPAVIWEGEEGETETLTYKELLIQVETCASGLVENGLTKGDAIGIHLPMIPETVVALLAINRIGAIAIPVFSGYGVEAISSRMNAVKAKALFMCDGFYRRGRRIGVMKTALDAARNCTTIEKLFLVGSSTKEAALRVEREMPRFVNAIRTHYKNINVEEFGEAYDEATQRDVQASFDDFFRGKGFTIDVEEFFTRMDAINSEENNDPEFLFEEVAKQYREEGQDISRDDLSEAMFAIGPFVSYQTIIAVLEEKGYKIDRDLIEKGMEEEPPKPGNKEEAEQFDIGIKKIETETSSEFPFEVIPWFWLLKAGEHKSTPLKKTSANDPAIILYSSGTTGKPKGIAHVHCGFPIKAAQDMAFGTDVGKGTRISWVTDIGWMMGPWLIYGALINGATMVLFDGSPDYPNPDRMWEFSAKHKVEILGISPTLIRVLSSRNADTPVRTSAKHEKNVDIPKSQNSFAVSGEADKSVRVPFQKYDLSTLRAFASTGEPWNPEPWRWLFEKVGDSKLPIINYSGGTEISGGILMGNPLLPQKPGSFPAPCPGMNVDILDEDGESVEKGEVGELSIKDTWIGMARGFWEENERYLETYWSRFDKIWVHGDFAMQDKDGHWYILGRSDDTLNVAGKRVGPAEIESLLVADERVTEAAVVGVPDKIKGTAMVAFCVFTKDPSASADDASRMLTLQSFESELKAIIAKDMGKPLTPKRIHFVSALCKTRNGKVMRRVIRSAYLGEDAGDLSALEDPKTVEEISELSA